MTTATTSVTSAAAAASVPPARSPAAPPTPARARGRLTPDDLHRFDDVKVELVNGRMVEQPMPGFRPARIATLIVLLLEPYRGLRRGVAVADGLDYVVPELRSGRESFRPDASWHAGPVPTGDSDLSWVRGAPTFAVEVRSGSDYGPAAETAMRDKRADYFEAGTEAVWDVDTVERSVRLFTRGAGPDSPAATFGPDDNAHAEPALPGWSVPVAKLFPA